MRTRPLVVTMVSLLALTGCKQKVSPEEAAAHLKAAETLYAQKDYPRALTEVQGAIKANPMSGDAHYLAAQIQEAMGNQRGAFEEYARAAVPDANNLKAQLKVAEILIDANQGDAALGRLNGTLGSHPNDPDALALRALAEQRMGSSDKARLDAQAALGRQPGQPVAAAVMAVDALTAKNADKALAALAPGLKAHPDDPTLLRLEAVALASGKKFDEAIAIEKGLLAKDPQSIRDRASLAELLAQANRVPESEAVLRDGIAQVPDKKEMRLALIAFLDRHGAAGASDAEMQAAIAAFPQDSSFDLLRAERLLRAGQPDAAADTLRTAIARIKDGPPRQAAQVGLARLDVDRGDTTEARKLLDEVVAAKPDNDDALLLRASLMLRGDEAAKALPDLLAVAGRQPRNPLPFSLLAEAYAKQGDLDKASDAAKKVAFFKPNDLAAAARVAEINLKANKPDLAKAALTDFIARNPDSLDGRVALVRLMVQQKDWAGAQAAIDNMRRLPQGERAVALMSAQLAEAKGQPDVAMKAYAKRLGGDGLPLDREALEGYARSAVAAKQVGPAIATVSALAGKLTGDDAAVANVILAALDRADGKPDAAIAALNIAMTAAPKLPAPYLELAGLQRDANPADALATLQKGVTAGAPAEPLLLAQAAIQDRAGNKDGALASYRAALQANPRSLVAANNYASLVADIRPTDKAALTEARTPIQRFAEAGNPALLDTLAWLDYRLGDFQSAKDLLVRAKAETSPNPQLRYHYGAVLIALGDKDGGRKVIRSALAKPFPGRDDAERLLVD